MFGRGGMCVLETKSGTKAVRAEVRSTQSFAC